MIIVAGGDSFVYGTELGDTAIRTTTSNATRHSRRTFFALLAKEQDMHYECVARPGNSNQAISRTVMDYCETHKDIDKFVAVSWTFPNRYEFRFPFTTPTYKDHWESISMWETKSISEIEKEIKDNRSSAMELLTERRKFAVRSGIYDFANQYFKLLGHTEYWEIYSSLSAIVMLQNYLELNKIPYMFTMADDCLLKNYTITHPDQSIVTLAKQLKLDNWFMFPESKGFYQWALENKYPVGDTHPLEEAHHDAAQLMKDKFNELVTKFDKQN